MQTFLQQALALLEEIDASPEKQAWCREEFAGPEHPGQDVLRRALEAFSNGVYQSGLVITNYHQAMELYGLEEARVLSAESEWLEGLPCLAVLACIACHVRRDCFDQGALIGESIAGGAMLRLFRRLNALSRNPVTTLETLERFRCSGVPDQPGVYWVLAPEGMDIRFEEDAVNHTAPLYPAGLLAEKYAGCSDRRILYIGKAGGKKGLRQRLRQYVKYGWGQAANHRGGRAIWQIRDAGMLLLTYETCPSPDAREHRLLQEYRAANGCYPLANWRG